MIFYATIVSGASFKEISVTVIVNWSANIEKVEYKEKSTIDITSRIASLKDFLKNLKVLPLSLKYPLYYNYLFKP